MPFKIKLSFLIFCKKRIEKQLQKNKIKRHSIKQKWEQACKLEQNEHMKINHNNQVHCQQTRTDSCSRTGLLARSLSLHLLTSVYTSQQPTQEIAEKSFVYNILKYISHHTVYREMQDCFFYTCTNLKICIISWHCIKLQVFVKNKQITTEIMNRLK